MVTTLPWERKLWETLNEIAHRKFNAVEDTKVFGIAQFGKLDDSPDVKNSFWIQAWRWGTWDHPLYGKEEINQKFADELIANFKAKTYGQELPFDYEHGEDAAKGKQAAGWIRDMEKRDDGVYYLLEFTDDALKEIREGKWRYISPEYFSKYKNPENGETSTNVPAGGAITNRPFFKGMLPLNFSEVAVTTEELQQFASDVAKNGNTTVVQHFNFPRKEDGNMNELLRKFAEKLGIQLPEDVTEDVALAKADELLAIIKPLQDAKTKAESQRSFRETFPDEYDRMIALETAKVNTDAHQFAANYERFVVKGTDGNADKKDHRGFSALVLEKIETAYKSFTEGKATPETFKDVLDHIASGGIVDYKEYGSSRADDHTFTEVDLSDVVAIRKSFGELVEEFMKEDNMEYNKAISMAAEKNPELFAAYQSKMPS